MIDNTIIKYRGKIFHNEQELKNFFKFIKQIFIYNEI